MLPDHLSVRIFDLEDVRRRHPHTHVGEHAISARHVGEVHFLRAQGEGETDRRRVDVGRDTQVVRGLDGGLNAGVLSEEPYGGYVP